MELTYLLIFVPILLLIEGFFSGAEIALISADRIELKKKAKKNNKGAKKALELLRNPEKIFSVTLMMNTFCMISISVMIMIYCIAVLPEEAEFIAVLITSPLIVIFGELIPKTVYQQHADRLVPFLAYPISWTYWIFLPFSYVLSSYTGKLSRFVGPVEELVTGKKHNTREQIRSLLSYSKKETDIKSSTKKMIKRIFDFKDAEAKHALIPLVRVEAIENTATVKQALEKFERHRHSRMPVFQDRIDNIIGILETADLFGAADLAQDITRFITPACYAAETQSLDDLLIEMRREDNEMVVVVDEHGGAVGILTLEDIVEEIVGDIRDEYDTEASPFRELEPGKWVVQAKMEIQEINEKLKIDLPQGDYETLSGFLLLQFGRIPEPRNELFFNTSAGSFKFTVRNASERHIETVLIERIAQF
jgi:CBS domain containing-hemolysin-like protein